MAEKQVETEALRQVKETMECCICTERFTDPRMLPCIHTFCLTCIQQTGLPTAKKPGDVMPCPVCRKPFKVPVDGFTGLPKNFFIERLMCILSNSERAKTFCGICSGEGDEASAKSLASVFCVKCWEHFCENCHKCHQAIKAFSNHQIVTVGSQGYREALLRNEESFLNYCGTHHDDRLNFFCFDCRQMSCKTCASTKHSGHKCIHNVKAAAEFEKEIKDEVNKLQSWTQEVQERKRLLKREVAVFNADVEKVAEGIVDMNEELKQLIDLHTATLLEELNSTRVKKLQEFGNEDKFLEGNLDAVNNFKTYCSELNFSAQEAGFVVESVRFRAKEITKQTVGKISMPRLLLRRFDVKALLDGNENMIGKIEDCPVTVRGTLDTVNHSLYGVTRLQNKIYALSQSPKLVLVYDDQKPFTLALSISLEDLEEPCDMAGCLVANCLYIADTGKSYVWKVSASKDDDVTCWVAEERYISSLSVSSLGQVVVLRKGQQSCLTVYRDDATVIRCILLEGELSNALHAVQKSNGNFVISLGAGLHFGICEMSNSGNVVRSLSVDDESQQVKYPCHLALISDDRILVTDFYKNRIILLDSELKFSHEMLSKQHHDLTFPWRICYDESCKQLLVVHGGKKVACGRTKVAVCRLGVVESSIV